MKDVRLLLKELQHRLQQFFQRGCAIGIMQHQPAVSSHSLLKHQLWWWRQQARGSYLALHEMGKLGQRERRSVDLAHEEALEHHFVERRVRSARQEAVQLHTYVTLSVLIAKRMLIVLAFRKAMLRACKGNRTSARHASIIYHSWEVWGNMTGTSDAGTSHAWSDVY